MILLFEKFISLNPVKKSLPKFKYKHSKRVADLTKDLSNSHDVYNSALYHDVLERTKDYASTRNILNYYSYQLVLALTHDDNEDTLASLKKEFASKEQSFINDCVIIKICDRTDNLIRKIKKGKLTKKYIKKSTKLIQYLYDVYQGDKNKLEEFIFNHLSEIPKLTKKIRFDSEIENRTKPYTKLSHI